MLPGMAGRAGALGSSSSGGSGGGGGGAVTLYSSTYSDDEIGTVANANFQLASTGTATGVSTGSYLSYAWTSGTASDYDVLVTLTSGTFSTGTTGSWLNLGTTRSWSVSRATNGSKTATATFQIRHAVSLTVLATATITLTASVEP